MENRIQTDQMLQPASSARALWTTPQMKEYDIAGVTADQADSNSPDTPKGLAGGFPTS